MGPMGPPAGSSRSRTLRLISQRRALRFSKRTEHTVCRTVRVLRVLQCADADGVLHAISDAIFGALAQGDIGTHFPPDDKKWKDAPSEIFLKYAVKLAKTKNFEIGNVDCTIICEKPKIKPHAELIKINIQNIINLKKDRISVKATTTERLGFTGREEGIAALATATLISP